MSVKKIVLCSIALIIAIFTIAIPAFNLYSVTDEAASVVDLDKEGEMGYDFIDAKSELIKESYNVYEITSVTYAIMIIGILSVLLVILAFILFKTKLATQICSDVVLISFIAAAVYFVVGYMFSARLSHVVINYGYWKFETAAHIPFAVIASLCVVYMLCAIFIRDTYEINSEKNTESGQFANAFNSPETDTVCAPVSDDGYFQATDTDLTPVSDAVFDPVTNTDCAPVKDTVFTPVTDEECVSVTDIENADVTEPDIAPVSDTEFTPAVAAVCAPAKAPSQTPSVKPTKEKNNKIKLSEAETINLLIKYKRLLDSGVITQEDFDEKKRQIL